MTRRRLLVGAMTTGSTMLFACSGPIPVFLTTTQGPASPELSPSAVTCDLLDDAFGIWGLAWEPASRRYGAVSIELVALDDDAIVRGRVKPARCTPSLWSDASDSLALAHEIGHVLLWRANEGSEEAHEDTTVEDVMHPEATHHRGDRVDPETMTLADFGVRRLLWCR